MKILKVLGALFSVLLAIFCFVWFDLGRFYNRPQFSGEEVAKHVIMISLDAVYEKDFETLVEAPIFSELLSNGSYSTDVMSIFPTLTYPVHTSIITGTYPNKHGVYHNHQLQPGISDDAQTWFWYTDEVKVPSLFDKVSDAQMISSSLFWPVTGGGPITYNLPEIIALEGENQILKLLASGSPVYLLQQQLKHGHLLDGTKQPHLDQFTTALAVDTIKSKKPNLLTVHLIAVDDFRHSNGVDSNEAANGLQVYVNSIEAIVEATKEAGIYEDTVFVITSDHGQVDVTSHVYLNTLFQEAGFINHTEHTIEYLAYAQSNGASAYIHIKDQDPIIEEQVRQFLNDLMQDEQYGIDYVYTKDQLESLHVSDDYLLAVEAKEGFHFKDELSEVATKLQSDYNENYATHGYNPLRDGYKNVFLISGNGIESNRNIGPMNMVDIAPTVAAVLGLDFSECDGQVLDVIKNTGDDNGN